jgi:uncharacterized protein (DUF1501 family)
MHDETHPAGCQEYHSLARRDFLMRGAGFGIAAMLPTWLPNVVLAQSSSSRDVIISIFLSGGMDGMSLVVPFGDPAYYTGRPTIAIPRPDAAGTGPKATALDNFFGFSPGMAPLMPAYTAGDLLVAHATGSVDTSRSHFDAQRYIEVGKPQDLNLSTGWLGRHLATVTPMRSNAPLRALGLASGQGLPQTLVGGPKTLPIPSPNSFRIDGNSGTANARAQWLATNYAPTIDPVSSSALDTTNTITLLQTINFNGYVPQNGAVYPAGSGFANQLKATAALIKADVGVEAVHAFLGGWDTHTQQGPLPGGYMHNQMLQLSQSLAAFYADVIQGTTANGVTVVVISEFGRNARENGDAGTDHGRGNVAFVMGKKINGGRVLTNGWPGLAQENLESGQDLRVTLDHRDILAEVVKNRLGNNNLSTVFPDFTPTVRNVTKA